MGSDVVDGRYIGPTAPTTRRHSPTPTAQMETPDLVASPEGVRVDSESAGWSGVVATTPEECDHLAAQFAIMAAQLRLRPDIVAQWAALDHDTRRGSWPGKDCGQPGDLDGHPVCWAEPAHKAIWCGGPECRRPAPAPPADPWPPQEGDVWWDPWRGENWQVRQDPAGDLELWRVDGELEISYAVATIPEPRRLILRSRQPTPDLGPDVPDQPE